MCLIIIILIEKKLNGMERKIKLVHIIEEMVYKLNERLADGGYAIRFKYEVSDLNSTSTSGNFNSDNAFHKMVAVLPNDKGLQSYIINMDSDLYEQIKCWFLINYKIVLGHNNTRDTLWAVRAVNEAQESI